ncbi:MAG: aromatic ring-hydroxylating dioxygenase subunit alpha [Caulobacteraceae bacterium]|nr:aromatic ring-hydroxylating dioxygenase subunit alpha [Caulobacteraceae bacterium]
MTSHIEARGAWLENTWYVAARSDELGDAPLGRTICGHKMVFFRGGEGKVAALEDFCPHRGAPLSLGFLKDGGLTCGYHGLSLDCRGKPQGMSGQDVSRLPGAKAYPCVERHGFIWVWPGDASRADEARLPRLHWAEDRGWAYGGGLYHIRCDYRLMIDNLMDLTHETYVHATSIGQKEIDETPVETVLEGGEVITRRFMRDVRAPPFWRAALAGAGLPEDAQIDRWQICRFSLPSHVMIEVGVALAGHGGYEAEHAKKASSIVVDFITPETETSHWYFWGMARNFAASDATLTETIRAGQGKIFSEDLAMLEQQQDNLTRNPGRRLVTLNIDAGGAQSRAMIERALKAEATT